MTKKKTGPKKATTKKNLNKQSKSLKSRIQSAINPTDKAVKIITKAPLHKKKKNSPKRTRNTAKSSDVKPTETPSKKATKKRIPAESLQKSTKKSNPVPIFQSSKKEPENTRSSRSESKKGNVEIEKPSVSAKKVKKEEVVKVETKETRRKAKVSSSSKGSKGGKTKRIASASEPSRRRLKSSTKKKAIKSETKEEDSIEIEINLPKGKSPDKKKSVKQVAKEEPKENISIEIDNIIKKLEKNRRNKRGETTKENKKSSKSKDVKVIKKVETKLTSSNLPNNKQIANLRDLNSKSKLSNSDFILAILEISLNAHKYGIEFLNKSKFFWEAVTQLQEFKNIFLQFKPETLRKYWRFISETDDIEKILDIVKKFKTSIDDSETKLLTVISIIREFIEGKIKDLEDYLKNYMKNTVSKYRIIEEEVKEEGKDGKLISRKRKRFGSPIVKHFVGKVTFFKNKLGTNAQGILSNQPWTPKKKIDTKTLKEQEKRNMLRKSGKSN